MRAWSSSVRSRNETIAFVPTMGFLHEGHLSLVRRAAELADHVVVSIFVNPTQFAPHEDFDTYPRDIAGDLAQLETAGATIVFTPARDVIYPDNFATYVVPENLASGLCGATRPGFFRGVCTVVLLLFRITGCHVAVFGEKDYQQLQIIRRMSEDLWLDVDVVGHPIVREADGLAKSSRNAYLSAEEREQSLVLSQSLFAMKRAVQEGERDCRMLIGAAKEYISTATLARIDYISIVDATNLQPIDTLTNDAVCAIAVHIGQTRLIDNQRLTTAG